jgi:hypothetical protein
MGDIGGALVLLLTSDNPDRQLGMPAVLVFPKFGSWRESADFSRGFLVFFFCSTKRSVQLRLYAITEQPCAAMQPM